MHVDVENELREAMSDTVKEEGKRDIVLFVLSSKARPQDNIRLPTCNFRAGEM